MKYSNKYENDNSQTSGKKLTFKTSKFKIEIGSPGTSDDSFNAERYNNQNKPFSDNSNKERNFPPVSYTGNASLDYLKNRKRSLTKYLESFDSASTEIIYKEEKVVKPRFMKYFIIILVLVLALTFFLVFKICADSELLYIIITAIPFLGVFLLVGIYLMLLPKVTKKQKLARCKRLVNAKIVDVRICVVNNNKKHYPTYKLYHNNKIYIIEAKTKKGFYVPQVGDFVPMFINEEDPSDFYIESKDEDTIVFVLGLIFGFAPIILFVLSLLLGQEASY